ncbi:MAG TPA: hypothetical protein VF029_00595 [Actinomycetota bacterium]
MRPLRPLTLLLGLGLLASACASGDGDPDGAMGGGMGGASPAATAQQMQAFMASADLYVGEPQRVALGLVLGDGNLVSFGSADFAFSYLGTAEEPTQPEPGPGAVAVYLPTPGTPEGPGGGPTVTAPSEGRGVYRAEDVTFDRAGFWQVLVTAEVEGLGAQRAQTTFAVREEPALPAPGQPAPETENLTMDSKGVPEAAVDSRFTTENEIPDPELHRATIAGAVGEGRPALVVFSTPVFCVSRFCGPVTELVEGLAGRFEDRAAFIHVEIWQDFESQEITEAAAEWLLRDGELTEPWLYLIGADGTIEDRWTTVWREEEVAAALEALPPIEGT